MTVSTRSTAPAAAGPTSERAEQLLAMTRRLITLINAEIEALNAKRLDGASADWDEKERLAHAWRLEVAHVKANPGAIADAPQQTRVALREASKELEAALEIHAHSLSAMKFVTEGLVRTIAAEIAASRSAPAAYGRGGMVNLQTRNEASGLAVDAKA